MMLRLVFPGSRRDEGDGRQSKFLERTFIDGDEGFMGVGVRFWLRYQAKILWPNFCGLEEAPATAKRGEDMNVRAAVCMFVVGVLSGCWCGFEGAGISGWSDFGVAVFDEDEGLCSVGLGMISVGGIVAGDSCIGLQ